MTSMTVSGLAIIFSILLVSCEKNDKIFTLLKSNKKDDIIKGASEAGSGGNKIFVPELLNNSGDPRRSTSLFHYGVSIYQAKMKALEHIFQKSPPDEITMIVDSVNIKFYIDLAQRQHLLK